jgi:hypothetical protein
MWKNQVLAMTKIPKKPITPGDSTRFRKLPKPEGKELREEPGNNVVTMKKSSTKQSQERKQFW